MNQVLLIVADPRFGYLMPEPLHSEITFKTNLSGEEKEILPLFADCEPENIKETLLEYLENNKKDSAVPQEFISAIEKVVTGFSEQENRLEISEQLFSLMSSVIDSLFNQQFNLCRDQMVLFKA